MTKIMTLKKNGEAEFSISDRIHQARLKNQFLMVAFGELWGPDKETWSSEVCEGAGLLMEHINSELEGIVTALDHPEETLLLTPAAMTRPEPTLHGD